MANEEGMAKKSERKTQLGTEEMKMSGNKASLFFPEKQAELMTEKRGKETSPYTQNSDKRGERNIQRSMIEHCRIMGKRERAS